MSKLVSNLSAFAVQTIIELVTMSAGIISKQFSSCTFTILKIPRAASTVSPPAAANESVHPGYGSLSEHAIIEGLKITVLTVP